MRNKPPIGLGYGTANVATTVTSKSRLSGLDTGLDYRFPKVSRILRAFASSLVPPGLGVAITGSSEVIMQARTLRVFAAVLVTACSTGDVTEPPRQLATNPLSAISDGANGGGNSDFFFLPPMVDDPSGNSLFLNNGLNASLVPTVTITTGAPAFTTPVLGPLPATFSVDHYRFNWAVPVSSTSTTYRVRIHLGTTSLGFADVLAAANSTDLKNADGDVVALRDGRTLPIKFTIENFALCGTTGQPTCASETIDLAVGGEVTIPQGGVDIQPNSGAGTTTVTVSTCAGIPTDLPRRGSCLRVLANPPLATPLNVPAEVWVCDSGITSSSSDQEKRFTMHRYDAPNTKALPHADDQCVSSITDAGYSLKGVVAELFSGRFRSAGKQLRGMLGPRPLFATAVLDVGAGGETDGFSDFQLLLPSKMTKCGGDGLTVLQGSVVAPKVCVTDLAGTPVAGATVHFATSNGSVTPLAVITTGPSGEATASWTIGATPGSNALVASGNGIASAATDGPRGTFDPFQPFPYEGPPLPGESGTPSGAVNVLTGSETFTATGVASLTVVNFGDNGYSSYGPFSIASPYALPSGWPLPAPAVSATVGSDSPFGGNDTICSITSGFATTTFPVNTDILVTKAFATPSAGTLTFTVRIDNDVKIYLDGTDITSSGVGTTAYNAGVTYNGVTGWWIHDGCADVGNPVFTKVSVPAGNHTLSIWAHDRGSVGYIDVKVVLTP